MSELNYLQFQPIDPAGDDISDAHSKKDDDITLNEQINEDELDNYWDQVVADIHQDPEWFTFADE